MTLYSIYARPEQAAPAAVPDRFSWFAALFPPVFALVHGLWLALAGMVLFVALLAFVAAWVGPEAGFWLYVLAAFLFGLEASGLRRAKLARSGWVWSGDLVAAAEDLAQTEWLRRSRQP